MSSEPEPQRILLVEDNDAVRELAGEFLSEHGYGMVAVADAESALPYLESATRFDLLLSDIGLPGMDGRALVDRARALFPNLPVIMITGYAGAAMDRADFLAARMNILPKPFSLKELLAAVRAAIPASSA